MPSYMWYQYKRQYRCCVLLLCFAPRVRSWLPPFAPTPAPAFQICGLGLGALVVVWYYYEHGNGETLINSVLKGNGSFV